MLRLFLKITSCHSINLGPTYLKNNVSTQINTGFNGVLFFYLTENMKFFSIFRKYNFIINMIRSFYLTRGFPTKLTHFSFFITKNILKSSRIFYKTVLHFTDSFYFYIKYITPALQYVCNRSVDD